MRIHPPVSPLRKGGALRRSDPFPFPPYEGGIQGGSSGASLECMQHNREAAPRRPKKSRRAAHAGSALFRPVVAIQNPCSARAGRLGDVLGRPTGSGPRPCRCCRYSATCACTSRSSRRGIGSGYTPPSSASSAAPWRRRARWRPATRIVVKFFRCFPKWVERVDPLVEPGRRRVLLECDLERNRGVIVGRERPRPSGCIDWLRRASYRPSRARGLWASRPVLSRAWGSA